MGYMHIENLYKCQDILLFKECYALEKIHGTSAHVSYRNGEDPGLWFFAGGESHTNFVALFNQDDLKAKFKELIQGSAIVYGEAYGGKQQGMKDTYGDKLRFIVFDVQIDGMWLSVPQMDEFARALGLDVVFWEKCSTDLAVLDAARDRPSVQARLNGCGEKHGEGVVLRPLIELKKNNGDRVIAKHKGAAFAERVSAPKVVDPSLLVTLEKAEAIAFEWVTPMRLAHVLDKIPGPHGLQHTGMVIKAMVEDVYREAKGEIVESREAEKAISKRAAQLFKKSVTTVVPT